VGILDRLAGALSRAAKLCFVNNSAHRSHLSAMRRQVSLSSGLRANLAISSHSAACFKNSSGGFIGVITLSF
jgi:hypothetical protein